MSGWTAGVTTAAAVATVGSVALATLGWLARKVWKAIRRLNLFLDDYEGTPARPGVAERPGVMERLQRQDAVLAELRTDVAAVVAEMPKNGVPLATKIDALWTKHLAEQAALAAAALIRQGVPAPAPADPPAEAGS